MKINVLKIKARQHIFVSSVVITLRTYIVVNQTGARFKLFTGPCSTTTLLTA